MRIKMLQSIPVAVGGISSELYEKGKEVFMESPQAIVIAEMLIKAGYAEEVRRIPQAKMLQPEYENKSEEAMDESKPEKPVNVNKQRRKE